MKNLWKILIAGVLAATGVVSLASPTYAEDEDTTPRTEISVSPTMSVVTLFGGDVIEKGSDKCPQEIASGCAVEVKNTGNTSYRFRVHVTPYSVSGNNNDVSFSENSSNSYSQIARWITFLNDDGKYVQEYVGELAPGETRTVYYKINVPEDIPGGAQYAAIWAQTLGGSSNGTSVRTVGEAGMTIRGRSVGDTKRTGEITSFDFQKFSLGGPLEAHASVKNTGNTDYEVQYEYTARTVFGKELHSDTGTIAAWPGSDYNIDLKWEDTPFLGILRTQFKVTAADAVKDETHIVLIMPIFIMILLILLLTVIIIWIIIIIRKRKERKARTLV